MEAKLYVILGSHACRTGMLLLEHKGIEYETVRVPTGLHPTALRLYGFPGSRPASRTIDDGPHRTLAIATRIGTVPALRMGGKRVQTNREIARFLDSVRPDPRLLPAAPGPRREVEEAERFGDEVLQMEARRLVLAAAADDPDVLAGRGSEGRLGPLLYRNDVVRIAAMRVFASIFAANRRSQAGMLASVPEMLDRVDGWVDRGVLNGEALNAADHMIAPSLALLAYRLDIRPEIERRPAWRLVDRVLPGSRASRGQAVPATA